MAHKKQRLSYFAETRQTQVNPNYFSTADPNTLQRNVKRILKDIANDEKSQFKIQLINLLKNNNFMQQRAVKMSITNFLELLNLFNNNGIHFN